MPDLSQISKTCAVGGLGLTAQGKVFEHGYVGFAVDALRRAIEDAGIEKSDIDGLLVNAGISWSNPMMASSLVQQAAGLADLRLSVAMAAGGATAGIMIQQACQAIYTGQASVVACIFSDSPLKPPRSGKSKKASSSKAYAMARGWDAAYGFFGVNVRYAMLAQRHMDVYGTTQDQLGRVAVYQREWASDNAEAQMRDAPLSLDDYHGSRWIVEPFHLFDCCLVSNGGAAVIVTSTERAKDLRSRPVPILGYGQGHPGTDPLETLTSGAIQAGPAALQMAALELDDIDLCELYDCYTFTVINTLEDYGFCEKGEGGPFIDSGATRRNGKLPVNTGGGQLSSFYMWGMTPIVEAVIQLRGEGGNRQVDEANVALVSGNGGILSTHSTLLLGSESML